MEKSVKMMAALVAVIAIAGAAALTGVFGLLGPSVTGSVTGSGSDTSVVRIPLSEISGNVKFYEYDAGGTTIRFFAVKAGDGSIKTAFDACDVCYKLRKGYRQEGDYLVCNNCGKRFAISSLGTENRNPGGCWPGYLPSSVEGDSLVIKKSDLEGGRYRFA